MTTAEASVIIEDLTKQLSATRAALQAATVETEQVRLVAHAAVHHAHQLDKKITALKGKLQQQARDRPVAERSHGQVVSR